MAEILHNTIFHGAVILAHNGGSYDCQFILQYLEKNLIPYEKLQRPGSIHKYLSLTILKRRAENNIVFKDFMMFMTGSLKDIAEGFKLPISKGYFLEYQQYSGSIPPLHSDEDYYCSRPKKPQDIVEIEEW
jgi:DNA polymerase type B, organellar and viral